MSVSSLKSSHIAIKQGSGKPHIGVAHPQQHTLLGSYSVANEFVQKHSKHQVYLISYCSLFSYSMCTNNIPVSMSYSVILLDTIQVL